MAVDISNAVLKILSRQLLDTKIDPWVREKMKLHGAIRVYEDMGAALLLDGNGDVIAAGSDSIVRPGSAMDKRVAYLHASEKFPELAKLAPIRLSSSVECQKCHGQGFFVGVPCAGCLGLGWV